MINEPVFLMLVEDDPGEVILIRKSLERARSEHFDITSVSHISEAVEHLKQNRVDIILLDLGLPDSDGLATLHAILPYISRQPVLVLTVRDDEELAVQSINAGAQEYLVKGETSSKILEYELRKALDRQRLNEALTAKEARIHEIIQKNSDGIVLVDQEGMIRFTNPAAERLFGRPGGELLGIPFGFPITGADRTEIEIFHSPKGRKTVELQAANFEWNEESAVLVSLRDVTERKQMESELSKREYQLREAQRIAQIGSWEWVTPSNKITWSEEMYRLLGRSRDLPPYNYETFIASMHPDDRQRVMQITQQAIEAGRPFEFEYRFPTPQGEIRWHFGRGESVEGELGQGRRIYGTVQDITEAKKAEEEIKRQLDRLRSLREIDTAIASSFDLYTTLDIILQQSILQLNVHAAAILLYDHGTQTLGYAASKGFHSNVLQYTQLKLGDEYAGRVALERRTIHIPDLKNIGGKLAGVLVASNEDFSEYHGTPLVAKGHVVGVLEIFHRVPIKASKDWLDFMEVIAGQAAIAIDNAKLFEDIQRANRVLEQRVEERTRELTQTNAELEHADRAKDEFMATMTHELRTPLNSILGLSESLLEQRRDPLSEYQQRSLKIIESSGQHLLELINDVLDLSKIEAGMLEYYPQVVDVTALCRSSLAMIKEQAAGKSIRLVHEEDQSGLKIYADPRRLKQILVNLLTNAVKFTPDHGQVTLEVHADIEDDRVQFDVIDTGIGIAEEDLKKLFQPFVQIDSSLNRRFDGTGLGLALIQKLTDLHGGSIRVESKVDMGSRFTVNIPWDRTIVVKLEAIQAGDKPVINERSQKFEMSSEESPARGMILLAEDNEANTLTIGEYLESHGYKMVYAHDGMEAVDKAEKADPDIILMDIQMPVMDGLEAIRRLRVDTRFDPTPIIALTALAMPGDRERCLDAGANEYMSKPVSLKKLSAAISKMLKKNE